MNTPQLDTVYKSYIDAYHAAATLKKRDIDADTVVRIEKAPYSDGYVISSTPVCVEMFFLKSFMKFGMSAPGAFPSDIHPFRADFGERE